VKGYLQKQKSFALARLLCCISHHCSSSITHVTIATCPIQTFKTKYIKAQKQNFILLQYKPLKFKIDTNGLVLKLSSLLVMGAIVKEHSRKSYFRATKKVWSLWATHYQNCWSTWWWLLHPFAWSHNNNFFRSGNSKSPPRELQMCFTMSKLGLKLLLKRKNNTTLGKKPALWWT
jgi:hypothetical protein